MGLIQMGRHFVQIVVQLLYLAADSIGSYITVSNELISNHSSPTCHLELYLSSAIPDFETNPLLHVHASCDSCPAKL